ncbi:MAG: FAD-dependent oxidoreductase [Cyclobacteriaceae bacterium]|nr:FAD-dependent oxidoreductase [Cyclobacteriaceae bacterium]
MKYFLFGISTFLLLVFSSCSEKQQFDYDIVIYGGTSAGVIAAYTAKKQGKSVLLIEPGNNLGGLSSGGLGYTDIGNKYAISGLALDFYRRLGKHYGKFETWIFEPGIAESIFKQYIDEAGVEVLFGYRMNRADVAEGRIQNITLEPSQTSDKSGQKQYSAKIFMDCSYEGDLMAMAGVSYTFGRESNATYGETYNGVQLMTGHQFPDGVDPYKVPGDPSSGLLWGISDEELLPDGTGDEKLQAYNYRICLTNNPDNRVEIEEPENYDASRYELLVRLFEAQPDKRRINDYFIWSHMPNQKTDINNRGGFSTDMIGMNYEYAEGDYDKRREIIKAHVDYTKGLLYFYKTDPRVPAELRDFISNWGYPKDEYVNNGHWSPQLYVREVRRMVSDYVMTQANCQGKEIVEDAVGMAAYTMDSHNCQRIVVEKDGKKMVKNEGNVEIGGFGPYPIAYRSIVPKKNECTNLVVPVCLSASHIAYGSIRMEPVFMVLAQSGAMAACLAIDANLPVQDIDIRQLQSDLKSNPLADGSTPEIIVDNAEMEKVQIKGEWNTSKRGSFGPDLLEDTSKGTEEKSVRYYPELTDDTEYDVYVYYVKFDDISSITPLRIYDGKSEYDVQLINDKIIIEGQTRGAWVPAGRYSFARDGKPFAEIHNTGADGNIIADAVLFAPVK